MPGYDEAKESLSPVEYAMAGGLSGAITRCACQPFDVLKIRFQLQVEPINERSFSSKYSAVSQAMKKIFTEEGIFGLWKGHNAGQLLSVSYGLVQFQSFEWLTKASHRYLKLDSKSPNVHFICGSLSGVCATFASFPFDVIKTRFIAQGNKKIYFSMYHAFKTMLRHEGAIAFFRGLTPALLLIAPQAGAMFTFHNILLSVLGDFKVMGSVNGPTLGQNLLAGSLAGLIAKTLVYPLDLARKRLQLQGFQAGRKGFGENFKCSGMINCIKLTTKHEGIKGLYKGLQPSIAKAALTTALHFTGYDVVCQFFIAMRSQS